MSKVSSRASYMAYDSAIQGENQKFKEEHFRWGLNAGVKFWLATYVFLQKNFQKRKLKFNETNKTEMSDKEKEETLIELVREKELLYDKNHKDYNDRQLKRNAWISIGKILNMSEEQVQLKWTGLRTQYTDYLRDINKPMLGFGDDDLNLTPKHFRHEISMSFYSPYYKPYKNISMTANSNTDMILQNIDEQSTNVVKQERLVGKPPNLRWRNQVKPKKNNLQSSPETHQEVKSGIRKRLVQNTNSNDKLTNVQQEKFKPKPMDQFDLFCSSVAERMRKLHQTNPRAVAGLQIKIQQALFDAEFE